MSKSQKKPRLPLVASGEKPPRPRVEKLLGNVLLLEALAAQGFEEVRVLASCAKEILAYEAIDRTRIKTLLALIEIRADSILESISDESRTAADEIRDIQASGDAA